MVRQLLFGQLHPVATPTTQFFNVESDNPKLRATSARGRPDLRASSTASRRNSGGYFDGRPNMGSFLWPHARIRCPPKRVKVIEHQHGTAYDCRTGWRRRLHHEPPEPQPALPHRFSTVSCPLLVRSDLRRRCAKGGMLGASPVAVVASAVRRGFTKVKPYPVDNWLRRQP